MCRWYWATLLVIVNTNKPHELTTSAYNDRRRECEEALEALQTKKDIKALCELSVEEFDKIKDVITDPIALKRAKHAVTEEDRCVRAVKALNAGELEEFGRLMIGSHESLRDDFEVSCKESDILVEEALKIGGTIGARMTGGGFGGCTVNIVKNDAVDRFVEEVGKQYKTRSGLEASFYIVGVGDGAHELTED